MGHLDSGKGNKVYKWVLFGFSILIQVWKAQIETMFIAKIKSHKAAKFTNFIDHKVK